MNKSHRLSSSHRKDDLIYAMQALPKKTKKKVIKPFRKIKYSIQRIRYGVSDQDMWNADMYLAGVYAKILEWYITKSNSVPFSYSQGLDRNNPDIDIMCQRRNEEYVKHLAIFKEYAKNGLADDEEWEKEIGGVTPEKLQESLQWLSQHYTELWD